jgi:hypothetical protein
MQQLKQKKISLIAMIIGAIGGLIYWKFVGCSSGTCPIKSVWYWSTLWGAILGYLLGEIIADLTKKKKKEN